MSRGLLFGPKWAPDYTQLPTWSNSHFKKKCFWRRWDFQSSVIKLIRVLYSTLKNKIYFRCGNEFLQQDCKICTCGSDKPILGSSQKNTTFHIFAFEFPVALYALRIWPLLPFIRYQQFCISFHSPIIHSLSKYKVLKYAHLNPTSNSVKMKD